MSEEEGLIRAFVVKSKRDRWLECLSDPKRRLKLAAALAHFRDLDPRFVVGLASKDQHAQAIAAALRQQGARSTCSVISENRVSCVPGALGYFEGEDAEHRWILARTH